MNNERPSHRKLNLHQADLLYRVITSRTLTDAARSLNISQPAVSKQLQALQQSLGIRLFNRQGNRLIPTAGALLLSDQVSRAHASIEALNRMAANIREMNHGEISICASPTIALHWLPVVLADFLHSRDFKVRLNSANSRAIMDLAETGQIDLGLCVRTKSQSSANQEILFDMSLFCLLPEGHALAGRDSASVEDLMGERLILGTGLEIEELIRGQFEQNGLERYVCCRTEMSASACRMVKEAGYIAIIDGLAANFVATEGYTVIPFSPRVSLPVCLVTPPSGQNSATQFLIKHLLAFPFPRHEGAFATVSRMEPGGPA